MGNAPLNHSSRARAAAIAALLCIAASGAAIAGPDEDRAKALYDQAVAHYDLAEYPQAIAKFKEAYHLSREPLLLFDIAQAYRLAGGNCRNAVVFYRNYLRVKPDAQNRATVEKWLRELEPCASQETDPATAPQTSDTTTTPVNPPPPVPAPQPAASNEPQNRWLPWTLVGGGSVLALSAAGGLLWVRGDYNAALDDGCRPGCKALRDRLALRANVSYALIGVGAALAATGFVLWIRAPSSTEAQPTAYVAPDASGLVIGGTF